MTRRVLLLLAISAAVLPVLSFDLAVNTSPSLPRGLYLRRDCATPPRRGDLVLLCPPPLLAAFALGRGYLAPGSCPPGARPLGKIVLAVAGDDVLVRPAGLLVNGAPVPQSRPAPHDSAGRRLPTFPPGHYRVAAGQIWIFSPYHPLAWDSRYYGPVPDAAVLSRLQPLLVERSRQAPRGFRIRPLDPRTF